MKKPDLESINEFVNFGGYTNYNYLKQINVYSIIDLRAEKISDMTDTEIQYYKFNIEDGSVPTLEQIQKLLQLIDELILAGKKVFIHCNLGRGRAPLTTCLYLVHKGTPLNDAIRMIRQRKFVYLNSSQMRFLKEFDYMRKNIKK